jgi:hypothetical protein
MSAPKNLIDQLEASVSGRDIERRAETLRRITDLFFVGADTVSDEEIDLSGEVMSKLLAKVDDLASAHDPANAIPLQPDESDAGVDKPSHVAEGGIPMPEDNAGSDDTLVYSVWSRLDIPRQQMVKLLHDDSEALRLQMEADNPRLVGAIRSAIASARERIQAQARIGSVEFQLAQASLPGMHAEGRLTEAVVGTLVEQERFDHVVTALSLIGDLSIALVERIVAQGRYEQIMLLAKAAEFSWETALALIVFQAAGKTLSESERDQHAASYARMQVKTAKAALQFYRLRERAYRS